MPFLCNAWYAAGFAEELAAGPIARTILDQPVVIIDDGNGGTSALSDMCPHRFAPLSMGRIAVGTLTCPYHGMVFDSAGSCIHNPHGKGARPAALQLRNYPVRQQDGIVWIWMGNPSKADQIAPPSYDFLSAPENTVLRGYLKVDANYELVTDNLLDLSHAEFLHPFIMPEGTATAIRYRAEQVDNRVSAYHIMPDQPNTPLFELVLGPGVQRIDGFANSHWQAPANLMLETGAKVLDEGDGRLVLLPQTHLLTPETGTSTHYFWCVARDRNIVAPQLDAMLHAGLANAFEHEDEPMIKAVQQRMAGRDFFEMGPALLPMDEGSVRARRVLAKAIAQEQV
ncbi:aromatic ring-hydroxylating dioxygenase subunit alpha [Novosphingobium sp. MMS21-SN21R]|uniref:aromatic ring-hydroxylating dioxygenase subunit alpha n=1 Tax=Novosphingobium sp. MMS21-SN21R TaxID=2969298 RepID=UPI002886265B|nr:aromatic ring-hydroxylating dioxygenase subunit alpha [Novosphingobium sp. MMS21-SN21R]MDT0510256.1 aromatic ring-hydroxylating dioxygenase subunit alpha [Novosphingobium sp. MMS21-SN21R]